MKKIISVLLIVSVLAMFSACGKKGNGGKKNVNSAQDSSVADIPSGYTESYGTDITSMDVGGVISSEEVFKGKSGNAVAIPKTEVAKESEFSVPLKVMSESSIGAINLEIKYDAEKLDYVSFTANSGYMSADNEVSDGLIKIAMINADPDFGKVTLGMLTFKASAGATGESALEITCSSCSNLSGGAVIPETEDTVIKIS